MADAQDAAYRILNEHVGLGRPIPNLRLQGMLFLAQCEHAMRCGGEMLFDDDIVAAAHSPAVEIVRSFFSIWGGMPIDEFQDEIEGALSPSEEAAIGECCGFWYSKPDWELNAFLAGAWPYADARKGREVILPRDIADYALCDYRRQLRDM